MDKIRVLRILEYIGDREWVENTLSRSQVPANGERNDFSKTNEKRVIRSRLLGDFGEVIADNDDNWENFSNVKEVSRE
jgi:hypothetical protein